MTNSIGHIIGGKVVKEDGKSIEIFNPSSGKCIALATNASKKLLMKLLIIQLKHSMNGIHIH